MTKRAAVVCIGFVQLIVGKRTISRKTYFLGLDK